MISKLLASVKKEFLLLIRDKIGLSILFIMPMILILVMTLVQDAAFRTINEKGIPIVLVNNDNDSLGILIKKGLSNNELCSLSDSIDGRPADAVLAQKAVAEGRFLVGIIIPKGATDAIRRNVTRLVSETIGDDSATHKRLVLDDSVEINILIDPVTKKSVLSSIMSNLREFISEVKTKVMFETFSDQVADIIPDKSKKPAHAFERSQIIRYNEIYASTTEQKIIPNAVQHNVPAWAIFAMFFIAIPLSGSIMKEKNEGSVFRLYTMPSSYLLLVNGKIIVYVIVCTIQFLLMLSVGLYILPMLGLPALVLGNSYPGILLLTMATAFAATGYGVMVGTLAGTEHQAAIVGALSILLLSALGGIWVPTYVMPEIMRTISAFSPLNWALEGFYKLFLRGGNMASVVPQAIKLFIFFIATMTVSSVVNRVKRKT
jgi:ABC-2 type transport system permease protein